MHVKICAVNFTAVLLMYFVKLFHIRMIELSGTLSSICYLMILVFLGCGS